jgi:hypothetical protein
MALMRAASYCGLLRLGFALSLVVAALGQTASAPSNARAGASQISPNEIVRRAMERDVHNWEQEKNYTFIRRIEQHELGADGAVKSSKSEAEEVLFLYGQPYARLIRRNDQPLSAAEAVKVERKLTDTMQKRSHESAAERERRLADWQKRHEEEHSFLLEVPEAYDFRLIGEETLGGRPAYVLIGEPRQNFHPKLNAARLLPKVRPKLWIDKKEFQWLKLEGDVIDTITWGAFLLRLHPGAHIELEQNLVNNEVWLPVHARITFDARVALFKEVREDVDVRFSDYKKFRSDSRITSVGEAH